MPAGGEVLLNFAEELDRKPVAAEDLPAAAEPAEAFMCNPLD
jgi:hypothetical protein